MIKNQQHYSNNFVKKVRITTASSALQSIIGQVFIDEFVFGGKEDLKQGRSNNSKIRN